MRTDRTNPGTKVAKRIALALLLLGAAAGCAHGDRLSTAEPLAQARTQVEPPNDDAPPAVILSNTSVHELTSATTGHRYQVWVDRPASYATSTRTFPVVFVTDAGWTFPIVRSIRNLLGRGGRNIEDFILVGLTHDDGPSVHNSRSRDYTPTDPLADPDRVVADYTADGYGGAAAYRDYVRDQVFPLIARTYRADMTRKTYLGHSYGGLFGTYVLLTRPDMFGTYILGSPSLWFDKKVAFGLEREFASRRRDLSARVMMVTGEYERPGPHPRNNAVNDLVGDMRAFEAILRSRGHPGLTVASLTIPDEDHLTVFPDVVSRGLLWALPGDGPYTGG